ncbi:MAG TPA: TIM barrel protein [Limnochordia bacterium]
MRIGIRGGYGTEDPVAALDADLERYSALGFEGLEVCVIGKDRSRTPYDRLTEADVRAMRASAAQRGMSVASLSADWLWGFCQEHPKLEDWDGVVGGIERDVALASALGASTVLIHFGTATGTWAEARRALERMAGVAEAGGVRLAFEASIFRRTGLGGLLEIRRLVDEVDRSSLGIYEHPHYPRAGLPAHEEVELFGPRLAGVHLGRLDEVQIDWGAFLPALRRYYDGFVIFEVGYQIAAQNKAALDRALAEVGDGSAGG